MSRVRATIIHFVVSLAIGLTLFLLLWFVWYPAPMLAAIGGHEILLLIIGVDVFIGPLLTFVVFKSGKRSLKFDLAVIVCLQIAALVYGVSSLWEARPAYIAALGDKFQVVQSTEVTEANLAKAKTRLPLFGPVLVGTKAPEDRFDIDAVRDVTNMTGGGRGHFPQLHIPYERMTAQVLSNAKSIEELKTFNPSRSAEIDQWLVKRERSIANTVYQPIQISATDYALMLDKESAKPLGIAPFRPWKR
jgi:hypothetical protein